MIYKALIFDMDGVIIDSKEHVEQFWREKFEKYGVQPNKSMEELELLYHGRPARLIIDELFGELPESERQKLIDECASHDASKQDYAYIPGVKDILKTCIDLKLNTGLVTSALRDKVQLMLAGLSFDPPFDTIVTAERVKNGKPDPECYLLAAQELGVDPAESIVFEDSMSGVQAAARAGAAVVGINQPSVAEVLKKSGAKLVLPDFRATEIKNGQSETILIPDIHQPGITFTISPQ